MPDARQELGERALTFPTNLLSSHRVAAFPSAVRALDSPKSAATPSSSPLGVLRQFPEMRNQVPSFWVTSVGLWYRLGLLPLKFERVSTDLGTGRFRLCSQLMWTRKHAFSWGRQYYID